MRHFLLFTLMLNFACFAQDNTVPQNLNIKEKVGAIEFDPKIDRADFKLCDELNIEEYYQVYPKYKEGIKSIQAYFSVSLESLNRLVEKDGYVTIRFVINCEGETDRYRAFFVNKNYVAITGNESLKTELIRLLDKLDRWTPGMYDGKKYDAYQNVKFRIVDKKIVDILF